MIEDKKSEKSSDHYIGIGLCFGVAFGASFNNIGLGICLEQIQLTDTILVKEREIYFIGNRGAILQEISHDLRIGFRFSFF